MRMVGIIDSGIVVWQEKRFLKFGFLEETPIPVWGPAYRHGVYVNRADFPDISRNIDLKASRFRRENGRQAGLRKRSLKVALCSDSKFIANFWSIGTQRRRLSQGNTFVYDSPPNYNWAKNHTLSVVKDADPGFAPIQVWRKSLEFKSAPARPAAHPAAAFRKRFTRSIRICNLRFDFDARRGSVAFATTSSRWEGCSRRIRSPKQRPFIRRGNGHRRTAEGRIRQPASPNHRWRFRKEWPHHFSGRGSKGRLDKLASRGRHSCEAAHPRGKGSGRMSPRL